MSAVCSVQRVSKFPQYLWLLKLEVIACVCVVHVHGASPLHSYIPVLCDSEDFILEMHLARFELLMDRRPLLLNSVLLRQNPHNVHEWHKRVQLYEGRPREVCVCVCVHACMCVYVCMCVRV